MLKREWLLVVLCLFVNSSFAQEEAERELVEPRLEFATSMVGEAPLKAFMARRVFWTMGQNLTRWRWEEILSAYGILGRCIRLLGENDDGDESERFIRVQFRTDEEGIWLRTKRTESLSEVLLRPFLNSWLVAEAAWHPVRELRYPNKGIRSLASLPDERPVSTIRFRGASVERGKSPYLMMEVIHRQPVVIEYCFIDYYRGESSRGPFLPPSPIAVDELSTPR